MPIESGTYCQHCTDAEGNLQRFDERFQAMVSWQARRNPADPVEKLEQDTLAYMAKMPAWRDHPRVAAYR
jgi:hypothetical protein